MHRRNFLAYSLSTAGLVVTSSQSGLANQQSIAAEPSHRFCAFVKFVQQLKPVELAETLKELGYDGAELTVRPGGYIGPQEAKDRLPEVHAAFEKVGITIDIVTTSIVNPQSTNAEDILTTISDLQIPYYRLGFLRYDLKRDIQQQLPAMKSQLKDLASLNKQIGVTGFYQNHSGAAYLGATFWDLQQILQEIPKSEIGVIFDIRHACVEGGLSWPIYYNIIRPHILAFSMKDYRWDGLKVKNVALGEGRVDPKFYSFAKRDFPGALYSVHVEYLEEDGLQPNIQALGSDLKSLKNSLQAAGN